MEMVKDICSTTNLLTNDFDSPTNTFDISVLASTITKTDQLINTIKEQSTENVTLKHKLQSLNESAIQITNVYAMEKEKCSQLDHDNQLKSKRIETLEEQLLALQNQIVNDAGIHQQIVADFEQRLDDQSQYINLCKSFIAQGNILMAHNLCTSSLSRQYNNVKKYLKDHGEHVEDAPTMSRRKKIGSAVAPPKTSTTSTMTDDVVLANILTSQQPPPPSPPSIVEELPKKTFADKCIMHMPSTATRGTTTKVFIQTHDIGINFPEPISLEQIFKQTICDVPDLIPEINDFKWPKCHVETQTEIVVDNKDVIENENAEVQSIIPAKPMTKCIGTITGIKNVRRKINYTRKIKENLLRNCNDLYTIKKEEDSQMGFPSSDNNNVGQSANVNNSNSCQPTIAVSSALPINPQLSELWQILGQTIFSIVGTGRIFDQSSNLHLIDENLSQIRNVLNSQNDCNRGSLTSATSVGPLQQSDGALLQSTVNELRDTVLGFKDDINVKCKSDILLKEHCLNDSFEHVVQQKQQVSDSIAIEKEKNVCIVRDDADIQSDDLKLPTSPTNSQVNDSTNKSLIDSDAIINGNESNQHLKAKIFEQQEDQHVQNSLPIEDQINVNEVLPKLPQNVPIVYSDSVFKVPLIPIAKRPLKRVAAIAAPQPQQQLLTPKKQQHRKRISENRQNHSKRRRIEHFQFVRAAAKESSPPQQRMSINRSNSMDISFIKTYFKVPELIEPIDELVLDINSDDDSSDKNDENSLEKYNYLMENCLEDLMLSDSDSDMEDSNLIIDEGTAGKLSNKRLETIDEESIIEEMPELLPIQPPPLFDDTNSTPNNITVKQPPLAETIVCSSYSHSPASPTHSDSLNEWYAQPIEIPLNIKYKPKLNFFQELLRTYDISKRNAVLQATNIESNIDARLLGRIRRLIEIYLTSEWTLTNLKICYTKLMKICSGHYRIISMALIEIIEDTNDTIDERYTPSAPAMTANHQRVIVLVQKITETVSGFKQLCINQIEQTLFNFKHKFNSMIPALMNLAHFYLALNDIDDRNCDNDDVIRTSKARSFLYKSLYYLEFKAVPLIYVTLLAYPGCLPRLNATTTTTTTTGVRTTNSEIDIDSLDDPHRFLTDDQYDPLTLTLHSIITNISLYIPFEKRLEYQYYRKSELFFLLKKYYNYSKTKRISHEEIVQYLIDKLLLNDTMSMKNISYSLILIGKRNGCEWATKHIINQHLLPLLRNLIRHSMASNEMDKQIIQILFIFSSIIKAQPITDDISDYQQIFGTILNKIDRQPIQEAAVEALLRTSKFSVTNVYQRIYRWCPMYTISRKLYCMLQTFMHRKPLSFWEK